MILRLAAGGSEWLSVTTSKERLDMLDHLLRRPVRLADYFFHDLAVGVDQVAFRDLNCAVLRFDLHRRVPRRHIGYVKASQKILIGFRVFVFADAENHQTLG